MSFSEKLDSIVKKHHDLGQKLLDPSALGSGFARISKECSDLESLVENINNFKKWHKR